MSFLTIEKYTPHQHHLYRRFLIYFILLVVPILILAAWLANDLSKFSAIQAANGRNHQLQDNV